MSLLTIIAYADQPGVRIERLLWALSRPHLDRPPVELVVIDRCEEPDGGLLNQLNLYRSGIAWQLVRISETPGCILGDHIKGLDILSLPASAIPFENALWKLFKDGEGGGATARSYHPGPLCVYSLDSMGANLNHEMIKGCANGSSVAFCCRTSDWRKPSISTWSESDAIFVLYPPPAFDRAFGPDLFIEVVAANL